MADVKLGTLTLSVAAIVVGLTLAGCGGKDQANAAGTATHDAPNSAPASNGTPTRP